MEKEERSYYLVSYCGTRETVVQTEQEYKELSEEVKNYNNKAKNKYLLKINKVCYHTLYAGVV